MLHDSCWTVFTLSNTKKFDNLLRFDEVRGNKVTGSHLSGPLCTVNCSKADILVAVAVVAHEKVNTLIFIAPF